MALFMVFRHLHIIFAKKGSLQGRLDCVQTLRLTVKVLFQTEIYSRPIQTTAGIHMILQPYDEGVSLIERTAVQDCL
jgi:hypothetical protein